MNTRTIKSLIFFGVFVATNAANASGDLDIISLDRPNTYSINNLLAEESGIEVSQSGKGNNAAILQDGISLTTSIRQSGTDNTASTRQDGSNNVASISHSGSNNLASITQSGTGNRATIVQN